MNNAMMLLLVKGAISELTQEEQTAVASAAQALRDTMAAHGDAAMVAFPLVALEVAIKSEEA